jgi:DNA-binding Lrp family transcriptional regulator
MEDRVKTLLDDIDWKILAELQQDGRMTNVELSRRVGISAPPCLRRVRALEEAGIIKGYRTLLDEKALGFDVVAFCFVSLQSQATGAIAAFQERVEALDMVRECWILSGDIDFMLKCVAPDLSRFQDFVLNELTKLPGVAGVKTALTIRAAKDEAIVPIQPPRAD